MKNGEQHITQDLVLKNVLTDCCTRVIQLELEKLNVEVKSKKLGHITVTFSPSDTSLEEIREKLDQLGFEPINNKDEQIVEEVKAAIIDLVHHSTFNAMVRNSDYLVERFNMTYQYLTSLFSKHENITLEKYIILQKIEKVKELIEYNELTLSEIAYMMGYSSVQYLSTQFKNITGLSVSEYKKSPGQRQSINKLNS